MTIPLQVICISPQLFSSIFFAFNFQKFDDVLMKFQFLGVDFFQFILSLLHLLNLFMSFAKFRNLSAITIFSTTFFLLSCWDSHDINISSFVLVSQVPGILFNFLSQSALYYSDWGISTVLSSISWTPSSVPSILLLRPSKGFFILAILLVLYIIYFFAISFFHLVHKNLSQVVGTFV